MNDLKCGQYSLSSKLIGPHWDAVDKLHCAPEPMELHTLIHVHHSVGGRRPSPHCILQVTADSGQDHLEHREAAAEALLGQQVPFPSNGDLLK